jgi:thiamine pyrophosphate-dependent acetolactate synthase large subunit-like protein
MEVRMSDNDIPCAGDDNAPWGSDILADALREQDIPYVCLVPGASFRGLHDSIVNYLGNCRPRMLVCLHEEHSVAIAHGWAQVTETPLAAIVHTNVGLMHATMTIFNAWCDRAPVLVLGATGPFDAQKRRPWIDWIHTAIDQGSLVRDYTKWDDQPGSAAAAVDSIRRGAMIARTAPMGPVFINLDISIQEERVSAAPRFHSLAHYQPPRAPAPAPTDVDAAEALLAAARRPVILCGRVSRCETAWAARVQLAERLGARVYTLYNVGGSFPKSHPLHRQVLQLTLDEAAVAELRNADLVLSLDWTDLGGTVEQVWEPGTDLPPIISVSNDFHLHRGWSMDYHRIQPASLRIATTPEAMTGALLERIKHSEPRPAGPAPAPWQHQPATSGSISIGDLAAAFNATPAGDSVTLVSRPIGWPHPVIRVEGPLDFLGSKGGEGLGAGPGMAVGAALAIRDRHPGRITVTVLGDGDFLMGATALWTAANEKVPLLVIVANNRAYYNDVVHQERIARRRGRPVENRFIGIEIDDPAPDLAALARSLGCGGTGPISRAEDLPAALDHALAQVRAGEVHVLEVIVDPGYASPVAGKD